MTQKEQVKQHLLKYGYITTWKAIKYYKITRLSARIAEIKEEGYEFGKVRKQENGKWWVEYHLTGKDRERAEKEWKA